MYSTCQVVGIVLETMAASGNRDGTTLSRGRGPGPGANLLIGERDARKTKLYISTFARAARLPMPVPGIIMRLPRGFVLNR